MSKASSHKGFSGIYARILAGGERKARREIAPYLLSRSDDEIKALGYTRETVEGWNRLGEF